MKSVLTGILVMAVIGVIAWGVTRTLSTSSSDAFTSQNDSVRLD